MPRRLPILILVLYAVLAGSPVLAMGAETSPPAAVAQIYLISTRGAAGGGDLEAELSKIAYYRLAESSSGATWQATDAAAFQASALPGVPTTVLVHGNGTDEDWAVRHGNEFFALMKQRACGKPFRLIVWSWPAERALRRIRLDVQFKTCRSDVEAYYLARVLAGLPKGTPLSLAGYSLGCRTLGGALELLAGGSEAGRSLPPQVLAAWNQAGPRPIRVMLVAAALDADWLEPCGPFALAPAAVERILVSQNVRDPVLRLYSRLYGPRGPEALGHAGPTGTAGGKMEVYDVSCEVGRKHDFDRYEESSAVGQRLAWYTFLGE
jgi:hypothetical protein